LSYIIRPDDDEPYSDQIECARCGEHFYYELHACPNCGARVYSGFDEDEDELNLAEPAAAGGQSGFVEASAVLAGWFIAALILTALFLPLRNGLNVQPESILEQALLFTLSALSGFVSAWLVVRLVGRRWKMHGLLAGTGSLLAASALLWILHGNLQPILTSAAAWAAVPFVLWISWIGASQADRMYRTPPEDSLFGDALREKLLYQRLMAITRNDQAAVERLIAYEKRRSPRASHMDAMRRAVERWERDNR
jgi:hypothetical protein